jgi:hypothetical protein
VASGKRAISWRLAKGWRGLSAAGIGRATRERELLVYGGSTLALRLARDGRGLAWLGSGLG